MNKLVLFAQLFVTLAVNSFSQGRLLPQDSDRLRHGVLPNGLSYYVVSNSTPPNKIEIAFIDRAGHANEGYEERGLSHFIEHLNFRSTRHFPDGLRRSMQKHGLVPGVDIGGSTGHSTNYNLTILSNDSTLYESAFLVLRDWANGASFLPKDILEERAAILNEKSRGNDSVLYAMTTARYLMLNQNPLYSRMDSLDLKNMDQPIEKIKAFYHRWYEPSEQAVIIVGDINVAEVEAKVKSVFSDLPGPLPKLPESPVSIALVNYDVALNGTNRFFVVNHGSRDQSIGIQIFRKRKSSIASNLTDRENSNVVDKLFNTMLYNRIAATLEGKNLPFSFNISINRKTIDQLAGIDAIQTNIHVDRRDNVKAAIQMAEQELTRIEKWPFSESEFNNAKQQLKFIESNREEDVSSKSIKQFLIECFVAGTTPLYEEDKAPTTAIDSVNVNNINQFALRWLSQQQDIDILMSVPSMTDLRRFSKSQVFEWIDNAKSASVFPFVEKKAKQLSEPNITGIKEFYRIRETGDTGIAEVELHNGIRVFFKRLGPREKAGDPANEIAIKGFLLAREDTKSQNLNITNIAAYVVARSGLGNLSSEETSLWRRERNRDGFLSVSPYVLGNEVGFSGSCSAVNFNEMLKAIFYYGSDPKFDPEALAIWQQQGERTFFSTNPSEKFEDSIRMTIDYGSRPGSSVKEIVALAKLKKAYKRNFLSGKQFTFVITGYFEIAEIIQPLVRHLGALPGNTRGVQKQFTSNRASIVRVEGRPTILTGKKRFSMTRDSVGNEQVRMIFPLAPICTEQEHLRVQVLNEVIQSVLFTRLREHERGVYSVVCALQSARKDRQYYLDINFETVPENVDRLVAATEDEIAKMARRGIQKEVFENSVNAVLIRLRYKEFNSALCRDFFVEQLKKGVVNPDIKLQEKILRSINVQDIEVTATQFTNAKNYMLFTLF